MLKSLLLVALLVVLGVLSGCSLFHKKNEKSSAHLYQGDAPTMHYIDKPESAGGPITPY